MAREARFGTGSTLGNTIRVLKQKSAPTKQPRQADARTFCDIFQRRSKYDQFLRQNARLPIHQLSTGRITMNMTFAQRLIFLLFIALLNGCVTTPTSLPFNAAAHADLSQIEVLPMAESKLDVYIVNNPGYSFGLVGLAIAESHLAPRRAWLKEQVAATGFDHVATFRTAFDSAMNEQGYTVSWPNGLVDAPDSEVKRSVNGSRRTFPEPVLPQTQALLEVNFVFVGLASAGSRDAAPYRPTITANARLMDRTGKNLLFQETFVFNQVFPVSGSEIVINPDVKYSYADFDALKAAGPESIEGIQHAIEVVATRLADQLRRQ